LAVDIGDSGRLGRHQVRQKRIKKTRDKKNRITGNGVTGNDHGRHDGTAVDMPDGMLTCQMVYRRRFGYSAEADVTLFGELPRVDETSAAG